MAAPGARGSARKRPVRLADCFRISGGPFRDDRVRLRRRRPARARRSSRRPRESRGGARPRGPSGRGEISRRKVSSRRSTSRAWSPVVGSSNRKSAPREVAGRIRERPRASGAAPRRRRASRWAGRGACSRGPPRAEGPGGARSSPRSRRTPPRPRPSCRARRRCSGRGGAPPGRALWKRRPSQTSQRTVTSARNCMSIVCQPVPRQASQRPPGELNEKSRAVIPRETARAGAAKSCGSRPTPCV